MEQIALIINNVCGRLIIPLVFLVCIIFTLRIIGKKCDKNSWIKKLNKMLRKIHKRLGIGLIIVSLLHGIFVYISVSYTSILPFTIFDFKWGVLCFTILVLLWASYLFRKKLNPNWMFWHRILTIIFLITIILHITVEAPIFRTEEHRQRTIQNSRN